MNALKAGLWIMVALNPSIQKPTVTYPEDYSDLPLPPQEVMWQAKMIDWRLLELRKSLGIEIDGRTLKYLDRGLLKAWINQEIAFNTWVDNQFELAKTVDLKGSTTKERESIRRRMLQASESLLEDCKRVEKDIVDLQKEIRKASP